MIQIFVTGTDTDAGKTYITIGLINLCKRLGLKVVGLKPVASGCVLKNKQLYNDDALKLQEASSIRLPYDVINPFRFKPAIAPHIAAKIENTELSVHFISCALKDAFETKADVFFIEGAGGFFVPLNETETFADVITHNHFPVILVVDIKLGCLNHAILTGHAIQAKKINCLGWIANCKFGFDDIINENIKTLLNWLPFNFLGIVHKNDAPEDVLSKAIFSDLLFCKT